MKIYILDIFSSYEFTPAFDQLVFTNKTEALIKYNELLLEALNDFKAKYAPKDYDIERHEEGCNIFLTKESALEDEFFITLKEYDIFPPTE